MLDVISNTSLLYVTCQPAYYVHQVIRLSQYRFCELQQLSNQYTVYWREKYHSVLNFFRPTNLMIVHSLYLRLSRESRYEIIFSIKNVFDLVCFN